MTHGVGWIGAQAIRLTPLGWDVLGIDLSWPMLEAAAGRARQTPAVGRLQLAVPDMDRLPVKEGSVDSWDLEPCVVGRLLPARLKTKGSPGTGITCGSNVWREKVNANNAAPRRATRAASATERHLPVNWRR